MFHIKSLEGSKMTKEQIERDAAHYAWANSSILINKETYDRVSTPVEKVYAIPVGDIVETAYIRGAMEVRKSMIEKGCEWIKTHVMIPYEGEFDSDGNVPLSDYLDWCKTRFNESEKLVEEFRKVMEDSE